MTRSINNDRNIPQERVRHVPNESTDTPLNRPRLTGSPQVPPTVTVEFIRDIQEAPNAPSLVGDENGPPFVLARRSRRTTQ